MSSGQEELRNNVSIVRFSQGELEAKVTDTPEQLKGVVIDVKKQVQALVRSLTASCNRFDKTRKPHVGSPLRVWQQQKPERDVEAAGT
jgi:hypothetical protein